MASTFSASSAPTARSASAGSSARSIAAPVVDALVDHLAQIALDQRRRLGPGHVVEARHAQRADLQDVAEPLGGDQADARALLLEDGVGGDRGAVADLLDGASRYAGLGEQLGKPVDDGTGVVLDAGGDLLGVHRAVGAEQHDVGEGAADVDADAIGRHAAHSAAFGAGSGSCRCTLGGGAPAAPLGDLGARAPGRRLVDDPARGVDDHAIVGRGLGWAQQLVPHVLQHGLCVALERIAPAGAAGQHVAEHVAVA